MKNIGLFLIVIIGIGMFSCKKIDELTKFDIDYSSSFTVQSQTVTGLPLDISTPPVQTNSESEFESNNTRKDLIESIVLKRMQLSIKSPKSEDFSFLESIEVYITAEGLEKTLIASLNPIPSNQEKTIELVTNQAELKEYIKKDAFSLQVITETDEVFDEDVEIDVLTVFHVDAEILGI